MEITINRASSNIEPIHVRFPIYPTAAGRNKHHEYKYNSQGSVNHNFIHMLHYVVDYA